jgi:acyl carrier protein
MRTLIDIVRDAFPTEQWTPGEPLGLGSFPSWDSLKHFDLMLTIEEEYGVRFSVEELAECKSLERIAVALQHKGVHNVS